MVLSIEEQRLIADFRRLTPTGRDELLAQAALLSRTAGSDALQQGEARTNQCPLKPHDVRPETEPSPLVTE